MDQRNVAMGLASLGRGPDAALVHMSPSEVQALQRLAEQHGGSLTINPDTGLPEAGFLSNLLPTLVGVGLAGLTGGTSLAAMGTLGQVLSNPLATGLISGGLAGLVSGDWRQAAKWGLGVGGGQALAGNLATAGTKGITPGQLASATPAQQSAVQGAMNTSWAETGRLTGRAAMDQAARIAARNQAGQMAAAKVGLGTPSSYLGAVGEQFKSMPRGLGRVLGMKGTTPLLPFDAALDPRFTATLGPAAPAGPTLTSTGLERVSSPAAFEPRHGYEGLTWRGNTLRSGYGPTTIPTGSVAGFQAAPSISAPAGPTLATTGLGPGSTAAGYAPAVLSPIPTPTATGFAAFPGGGAGLGLSGAAALTPALFAENPELEEVDVGGKKIGYPPYSPLDRQVTYTEPSDLADTSERDYFSEPEYRPYDPLIDPWTPLYEPPPTAVGAQGGIVSLANGGEVDSSEQVYFDRPGGLTPETRRENLFDRLGIQRYPSNPNDVFGGIGPFGNLNIPGMNPTRGIDRILPWSISSVTPTDGGGEQSYFSNASGYTAPTPESMVPITPYPHNVSEQAAATARQEELTNLINSSQSPFPGQPGQGLNQGGLTAGAGDGMSDKIKTTIAGKQPAALSAGEFVVPADVVSGIGNGDTNSGAKRLYAMMDNIRGTRTGQTTQPQRIMPRLPA